MKYFAVFLPMLDQEKSRIYRLKHLDFLQKNRSEGKILANGCFSDNTGGLVIYRMSSFEEVKNLVEQDPYVIHKARNFEIHEWEMVSDEIKLY